MIRIRPSTQVDEDLHGRVGEVLGIYMEIDELVYVVYVPELNEEVSLYESQVEWIDESEATCKSSPSSTATSSHRTMACCATSS